MPLVEYADIRDKVIRIIGNIALDDDQAADAVLALLRKHIEAMPAWNCSHTAPDSAPDSPWLDKDDVLDLLGGDDSDQDYDAAPLMPSRASESTEGRSIKPRRPEDGDR